MCIEKILKKPNSKANFIVHDGDKLNIIEQPNIIQIIGEVSSPGFYKYTPNLRVSNIISKAGGFTLDAEKNDIFIRLPNGQSKKYLGRFRSNPKVLDGSIISVGKKKEVEPFDATEFAKELTAIFANLAQAIAVIILARN